MTWRDYLTPEEARAVARLDKMIAKGEAALAERKPYFNRARQRKLRDKAQSGVNAGKGEGL